MIFTARPLHIVGGISEEFLSNFADKATQDFA